MKFFKQPPLKTGLSTGRIEAFSDGVFAIAITLLILAVTVPEHAPEATAHPELSAQIVALWPKILSYAISFAVIGIFWVGHHIMFHYIKRSDRTLLWLNILFLMMISFIPFPAALLGQYGADRTAVIVYGATLMAAGLMIEAIWLYASAGRRLISPTLDPALIRMATGIVLAGPIVYLIAVALAFVNPLWSILIYIVVPVAYVIPSPIDRLADFDASDDAPVE